MNITFFIPAYNCSKTIAEATNSIMKTNFSDGDELIITNDCSTDNTLDVLKSLKEEYPSITIIEHNRNKGGAAARNTAVEGSKNELLFCLDADNVLENNTIVPLKNKLLQEQADIASFREMRFFNTQDPNETKFIWQFLPQTTLTDFMSDNKNPGSSGNYLFTKESWVKTGGYPAFAGALDTWGFGFMQLAHGCKMISLPNSYYSHRLGDESYYIRDIKKRNMSLTALQILLPYHNLISPNDLNYIMSRKNRYSWFDNYSSRPINIIEKNIGQHHLVQSAPINRYGINRFIAGVCKRLRNK